MIAKPRASALLAFLEEIEEAEDMRAVYARLDATHPEYSDLFVLDRQYGVRGAMLQSAFECIVDYAEGGRQYRLTLEATRANHDAYGLSNEAFLEFFTVIETGLKQLVGPHWSPAVAQDWGDMLAEFGTIIPQE